MGCQASNSNLPVLGCCGLVIPSGVLIRASIVCSASDMSNPTAINAQLTKMIDGASSIDDARLQSLMAIKGPTDNYGWMYFYTHWGDGVLHDYGWDEWAGATYDYSAQVIKTATWNGTTYTAALSIYKAWWKPLDTQTQVCSAICMDSSGAGCIAALTECGTTGRVAGELHAFVPPSGDLDIDPMPTQPFDPGERVNFTAYKTLWTEGHASPPACCDFTP